MTTTPSSGRPTRVVNRRRPPVFTGVYDIPRSKRLTRKELRHRRRLLRDFDAAIASAWISEKERWHATYLRDNFQTPDVPVGLLYGMVERSLEYWCYLKKPT